LRTYGWLLLLTLLSTYVYSLDTALRDLHIVIGAALAIFQVAASVVDVSPHGRDQMDGILLGMELLGFLLAVFTIVGVLHVLFLSQVLTSGAFALLLIRSAMKVDTGSPGVRLHVGIVSKPMVGAGCGQ